jgi:hypothetical protein
MGLLLALTRKRHLEEDEGEWQAPPEPAYYLPRAAPPRHPAPALEPQHPQIIVIAPPQGQFAPGHFSPSYQVGLPSWGQASASFPNDVGSDNDARDWRIIGEE